MEYRCPFKKAAKGTYTDHGTVGSVRIMNMNLFFDGCSDEMMNGGGWDYSSDDQRNLWNKNTDALLPEVTHWSQNTSSSDDWKIWVSYVRHLNKYTYYRLGQISLHGAQNQG